MGLSGGSADIINSVYSTLFFDNWKLRNFSKSQSRKWQTVDALVDMNIPQTQRESVVFEYISYSA